MLLFVKWNFLVAVFYFTFDTPFVQCKVAEEACICADKSLCKAIDVGPRQEVYGFSTNTDNWKHWDWDKITTVSLFGKWDKELLCYAHSKVTVDVAWSPKCIDSRCYDYKGLAEVTDFLVVMSYDERSQIHGPCVAGPNSAYGTTFNGVDQYINLGIKAKKLVLGLPWYGYNYPCTAFENNTCEIKKVPFRGVSCSDAAGRQYCYSDILAKYLPMAIGGRQFDKMSLSPFFNYKDPDGKMHQIWYDDVESLTMKYSHGIKDLGLRGLAFWNIDCLNYTDTAEAKKETKEMWDAVFVT